MIEESFTLLITFGFLYLVIRQIFRLFAHAMLNRTIRIALEKSPDQVPGLLSKLDSDRGSKWALAMFVLFIGGVTLMSAFLDPGSGERMATTILGVGALALGALMVAAQLWLERRSQMLTKRDQRKIVTTGRS